ncbi:MAG: hypothetical protein PF590_01050 [Candidatus Delongbacteria bacterium]|jgi:hypothetical protein|nr:hypothetical protein [Candidatus Delongbacteria bacterium]
MKKIQAFIIVFSLLAATTGYTIEQHFCTHCKVNFETSWFLLPAQTEIEQHACNCDHNHNNQQKTCDASCEIDRSVHVEHVSSDIQIFIPSKTIQKVFLTHFYVLYANAGKINLPGKQFLTHKRALHRPKIPDIRRGYLSNCVFRL